MGVIIAVIGTKVVADAFSHIIIPNPTLPLHRHSTPRVGNGLARKLYRRDGEGVYFRVTSSLFCCFQKNITLNFRWPRSQPASSMSGGDLFCPIPFDTVSGGLVLCVHDEFFVRGCRDTHDHEVQCTFNLFSQCPPGAGLFPTVITQHCPQYIICHFRAIGSGNIKLLSMVMW